MDSLEILVQDRSQKLNIYVIAGIAGILPDPISIEEDV